MLRIGTNNIQKEVADFIVSAEQQINASHNNASHIMIAFGINNLKEISSLYGTTAAAKLLAYIRDVLSTYVAPHSLYCQLNSDCFAIFLENFKNIDLALLVISLSEEITNYNKEYNVRLSFGICRSKPNDTSISALFRRAFYAKRTMKEEACRILADYNEIPLPL